MALAMPWYRTTSPSLGQASPQKKIEIPAVTSHISEKELEGGNAGLGSPCCTLAPSAPQ